MTGECGLNGYFGGFEFAYFTNHDDVRVLAENGGKTFGEGVVFGFVDLGLVDTFKSVFDWIFKGDDFGFWIIEFF